MSSTLTPPEPILRRMREGDLESALKLTQAEHWSHRLEDWQFHYQLGRGWVVCDANDAVMGTAIWWPYGEGFATLGLIVVDRSQQGKGIGRQLVNAVMTEAGARVLQLVATQAGIKLYQQCGFQARGGIEQRQGMPLPVAAINPPSGVTLRTATREDMAALYALDAQAFGADRSELLKAITAIGSTTLAEQDGKIIGYAMARTAGRGTVIGPIVADTQQLAITLIAHHLQSQSGFIRVDVPAEATELTSWLDSVGLVCVDRVTAMRRGDASLVASTAHVFGLASQAFG